MALSPQRIRETSFKSARKGYDQAEVDAFVDEVATALESAQNEATAMEARARAAVARLQELSQGQGPGGAEPAAPAAAAEVDVSRHVEESETISRTLLLAQRTADQTVADAQSEADRVLAAARDEATGRLDGAREESDRLVEEAKVEARRAGEGERVRVEGEVQALLARRDFLESDVDHLEQFIVAQRERITEAVSDLTALVERIPGGLADMRRPLLSAAAEPGDDAGADDELPADDGSDERSEISEITRVAAGGDAQLPPADGGDTVAAHTDTDADTDTDTDKVDVVRPWDAERT